MVSRVVGGNSGGVNKASAAPAAVRIDWELDAPQKAVFFVEQSGMKSGILKDELQPPGGDEPFAANCTYPVERYVRCHQTSGHGLILRGPAGVGTRRGAACLYKDCIARLASLPRHSGTVDAVDVMSVRRHLGR